MGFDLFEWQQAVLDTSLERRKDGRLHYRKVGLSVARQTGKSLLLAVRIALELLTPNSTVLMTSTDRGLATSKWLELSLMLQQSGFGPHILDIKKALGSEQLVTTQNSVFKPVTPSHRSGGRGLSASLIVLDEAAMLRDFGIIGALLPTTLAKQNVQVWMASNAGESEQASPVWWSETVAGREAISDESTTTAWFEWSPSGDPDSLDPTDPAVWAEAIPTLDQPGGVTSENIRLLLGSMPLDKFCREVLNLWQPSRVAVLISPEQWAACCQPEVKVPVGMFFGLDVAPEGVAAAIGACGVVGEQRPVEVVDARPGTSWVVARTTELSKRHGAPVVVCSTSPAGAFVPQIEANGVEVILADQRQFAFACGRFLDSVNDGTVAHLGDWRLDEAVAGATRRQTGDLWLWNRRGGVNISPLCAVTLAMWPTWPDARKPSPQIW